MRALRRFTVRCRNHVVPRGRRAPGLGDLVEDRCHDQLGIGQPQMRIVGGDARDEFCLGYRTASRRGIAQSGQQSPVSVAVANQ